jgi:hypothetical protein
LNGDGVGDPSEDINGDGQVDANDCTGPQGAQGIQGATGPQGLQGATGADGINCWDLNGDGVNDPSEDVNGDGQFDANDCIGENGFTALIKTSIEAAGGNCLNGGTKVEVGIDSNRNGILDLSEIDTTQTVYVCNGLNGSANTNNGIVDTGEIIHDYYKYLGNGSDGRYEPTNSITNYTVNNKQYTDFIINSNVELRILGFNSTNIDPRTAIIRVQDTFRIDGVMISQLSTLSGGSSSYTCQVCATGGGGGKDQTAGFNGTGGFFSWNQADHSKLLSPFEVNFNSFGGIGGGSSSSPTNGVNGNNISVSNLQTAIQMPVYRIQGTYGGGGGCSSPNTKGGAGGHGLIVVAKTIIINGTINLSGNPGENGSISTCRAGGGGGSGGSAIFSSVEFTLNGSFISLGGAGGSRCCSSSFGSGGAGGNGSYITIQLTE